MISPIVTETIGRIFENITHEFVTEKIKNAYVGAAIAPLVGTFVQTVLAAQKAPSQPPPCAPYDPAFLDLATRHYPEVR